MAPRIQFRLTDDEYQALAEEAKKQNYPDVTPYVKDLALGTVANTPAGTKKESLMDLYRKAVKVIEGYQPGDGFVVRDLVPNPPALLGRYIFEGVESGAIAAEPDGKDELGATRYKKL